MMNRRDVLNLAVAAGASAALRPSSAAAKEDDAAPGLRIVDTNVSLFHWPFRRLPLDDVELLELSSSDFDSLLTVPYVARVVMTNLAHLLREALHTHCP